MVSAIQREGAGDCAKAILLSLDRCTPDACMETEKKGRKNKSSCCPAVCWDRPGWQSRHGKAETWRERTAFYVHTPERKLPGSAEAQAPRTVSSSTLTTCH